MGYVLLKHEGRTWKIKEGSGRVWENPWRGGREVPEAVGLQPGWSRLDPGKTSVVRQDLRGIGRWAENMVLKLWGHRKLKDWKQNKKTRQLLTPGGQLTQGRSSHNVSPFIVTWTDNSHIPTHSVYVQGERGWGSGTAQERSTGNAKDENKMQQKEHYIS